ncbi:MAG TPA: hypothetical protein VGT00_10255 [Methylomirabilota bacterium]|jgi:hypothetical protein|nr:hypothetical protein [Methylomirabilota bacterium]
MAQHLGVGEMQTLQMVVHGPTSPRQWERFKKDMVAFLKKHKGIRARVVSIRYHPKPRRAGATAKKRKKGRGR